MSAERSDSSLVHLRAEIEAAGSPLSEALVQGSEPPGAALFGPLVGKGTRAAGSAGEYSMLVESIFEGYLLHYGRGRILDPPDADLRLLAGDWLYAFGLSRLAILGDVDAVDELADLISLCAQAHASSPGLGEHGPWRLTGALWALTALAIAAGSWEQQGAAKRRARDEGPAAAAHVLDVAKARAEKLGLDRYLGPALIGFDWVAGGDFSTT
jgi:hypothetical protein